MTDRSSKRIEAIHQRLKWTLIISSLLLLCNVVAVVAVGTDSVVMAP